MLADGGGGIGYLLKDRVSDIEDFVGSVERVATGGTVIDPIVVSQLIARRRDPVMEGAVEKYSARLFAKLDLLPDDTGHRRVRAVLTWLQRG